MFGVEHDLVATRLLTAAEELVAEPSSARVLDRIAELAPRVIPATEHASVTVAIGTGLRTAAATGALPRRIDALQYELDEGPCVAATRTGEVMLVSDWSAEPRWPRFAACIASQEGEVGSILAVPIQSGGKVAGSLNLASPQRGAFRDASTASALAFAAIAALALSAVTAREECALRAERVRELEDFTAVLGHDLRSGVTGALAAAAVLARRRDQLDSAGQQALGLLTEQLDSQMHLLVDLLHLARTRANDAVHSVALLPLVDKVLTRRRDAVELRVSPNAHRAFVAISPVLVRTILSNLLDNARRHAGGATCVEVRYEADRAWVAVDDAGPGVAPEQRPSVFTRFWTTDSSSSDGSGLGLALSREHARSAGGDLTVEDSAAGGARFVLALPAQPSTTSG